MNVYLLMSKKEKSIQRLLSKPKDFSYEELKKLLGYLGYSELSSGKTSGSRVAFFSETSAHMIRLHKPHPTNVLKRYQLDQLIEELSLRGLL
ncbi:hypothetical protein MASR2M78_07020 [Treponema sp.]